MNKFFALILLISIEFIAVSNGINVTVLAFGISKNASRIKALDPYPFNLDILVWAFQEVFSENPASVSLKQIPDNCTSDFDWEDESLHHIDKILNEKPDERFVHIGPLCEYSEVEAANSEILGYMKDTMEKVKNRNQLFLTSTLGYHMDAEDYSQSSHYLSAEMTSSNDSLPLFVPLNSDFYYYSELIFNFTTKFLSPYTAFLCPVKEYLGHTDKFCRRITNNLMRFSGNNNKNLVRFRYFGTKNKDEWLDIWNHVLQRSRYVIFCGDDKNFADWLEAGKHLWEKHKIENFAIFFLAVNFESSNVVSGDEYRKKRDETLNDMLASVIDVGNIKIVNIRSPVDCSEVDDFCNKFLEKENELTTFPEDGTKMNKILFQNKLFFYSLSLYKLFNEMKKGVGDFWQYTDSKEQFKVKYTSNKELQIYELKKEDERIKTLQSCSLKSTIDDSSECQMTWIGGSAPDKVPGECGYEVCITNETIHWKTIAYTVSGVIGSGLLIASVSVFCYLRYRRKNEWSIAPLGEVRIKIEEIKPVQVHHDDVGLKFSSSKKSKSTVSESTSQIIYLDNLSMDQVLGTYRSTPVIVHPFKVAKNKTQSVDEAVTKLRSLTLENVVQVHGYVVQANPSMHGLVMEYGEHGVLITLLKLDELDLALKLPLLADLCRALEHIHKSSLKHHGSLSSMCCVVDSHFVLKVQLTEFPTLKKLETNEVGILDHIKQDDFEKLWSAPEVLRKQPNVNLQLADIYSFGIIAHEIIYQRGPFFVSSKDLNAVHMPNVDGPMPKTSHDIAFLVIKILQNKTRRQIRPSFITRPGEEVIMLILKEMIKSCWEDNPTQRWNLSKINHTIRKVMHDMGIVNVFGSMVERLEFYSKHLQEAVQQKADKVEQERRRVRHVLEQLFPGIAKALINGEKPKPVQYTNICVYYNDLVGFTKICSVNTPSTVVKFLNTLFLKYDSIIEMYNIHPVTRIGDAYMLVSGIPIELKDNYHASEIAQAALQLVEAVRTIVFDYVEQHKSMQIRTGIASGRAATGVVGTDIPSYGICGDAVVVAAKMESSSEPMKILVAESSYVLLKDEFDFELTAKNVQVNNVTVVAHWLKGMKKVMKIVLDKRLDGKPRPERKFDEGASAYGV